MANNIHYKNVNVNAPWWWKRLESALVFFLTGLIPLLGLTKSLPADLTHDLTLVIIPGLILFVKTFGILFGEEQVIRTDQISTDNEGKEGGDRPPQPPPRP